MNRVCEKVPKTQTCAAQRLNGDWPGRADFNTRKNRGSRQVLSDSAPTRANNGLPSAALIGVRLSGLRRFGFGGLLGARPFVGHFVEQEHLDARVFVLPAPFRSGW